MGKGDIYELRDVRASPLPYHSYDNYRGQSCNENTSKILGVGCWSICMAFCSQLGWGGLLGTGSRPGVADNYDVSQPIID